VWNGRRKLIRRAGTHTHTHTHARTHTHTSLRNAIVRYENRVLRSVLCLLCILQVFVCVGLKYMGLDMRVLHREDG
jgi:hypothetical protein